MTITARLYQSEAIDKIRELYKQGVRRVVLVMPTGSGKTATLVLMLLAAIRKGSCVLIVCHRKELIDQMSKTLDSLGIDHGIIRGNHWRTRPDLPVQVASISTLIAHRHCPTCIKPRDPFCSVCGGKKKGNGKARRECKACKPIADPSCVTCGGKGKVRRPLPPAQIVALDECHRALAESNRWLAAEYPQALLYGLSVGPSSWIEMKGGAFGRGWIGTIEDAFSLLTRTGSAIVTREGFEIIDLHGAVQTRGWDTTGFSWKPVREILRHPCTKATTMLRVAGDDLLLTDDHSIYRVEGSIRANRFAKWFAKFVERRTDTLREGDVVAVDDGERWGGTEEVPFDVVDIAHRLSKKQVGVVVDLSSVTLAQFENWGLNASRRYVCRHALYGDRLPIAIFVEHRDELPPPTRVYWDGANGTWIDPSVQLSKWAYVLGFWIGDGWVEGNRIAFAVENAMVEEFAARVRAMPNIELHVEVGLVADKGSQEVRCSSLMFAAILRSIFGEKPSAKTKFIPGEWIGSWSREARLELLNGMIDSDGSLSERDRNRRRYYYVTTSLMLARGLLSLLRSLGVRGSIHTRKPGDGGVINGRQIIGGVSYSVDWSANALEGHQHGHYGHQQAFEHGHLRFIEARVRATAPCEPPLYVYDISVDGHPSFVANGVLVHNTATPWRLDRRGLHPLFDAMVCPITMSALIEQGHLLPLKYYKPYTPDLTGVHLVGGDYDPAELEVAIRKDKKRLGGIVKHWLAKGENQRTLFFSVSVADAEDVAAKFREAGVPAEALAGDTDEVLRDAMLARLASGETKVLCNCAVLTEGYDLPSLGCVILGRPTKSLTMYLQQVGRCMRPHGDQKYAIVLDMAGCVVTHKLPDYPHKWTLEDRKRQRKADSEDVPLVECPRCGAVRPETQRLCPFCRPKQTGLFGATMIEEEEGDLVLVDDERTPVQLATTVVTSEQKRHAHVCTHCNSDRVRADRHGDLQFRIICNACKKTSYAVDKDAAKQAGEERRRLEYDRLDLVRKNKDLKPGWVSYRYREIFGTWPPRQWRATEAPRPTIATREDVPFDDESPPPDDRDFTDDFGEDPTDASL